MTDHARDLFHALIPKKYISEIGTATLSEEGHGIRNFLGIISEEVMQRNDSNDIATFKNLCGDLSNNNGHVKKGGKFERNLISLANKYGASASEKVFNTYVAYCIDAWDKYHSERGVDVTDKSVFNEQYDSVKSILNNTIGKFNDPTLSLELLTQKINFISAECCGVSKTMLFHDLKTASDVQQETAERPAGSRADDGGSKYMFLGGAEKGGITIHLHIDNSNRNGDQTNNNNNNNNNTVQDGRHATEDFTPSMMDNTQGSEHSKKMLFELAKAVIDTQGLNHIINVVEKVQPYQPAAQSANQPGNTQDEVDFVPLGTSVKYPNESNENHFANNTVIRDLRVIRSESDSIDNGMNHSIQTQVQKNSEKPVTTSLSTSINDDEQLRSTERTVNRFTRHQPVHVQHYAPLNLPVETPKTLKSVAGVSMTTSPAEAESALKKRIQNDADRLFSVDSYAPIVGGETILTARLVQQLPEVSFPIRNSQHRLPVDSASRVSSNPDSEFKNQVDDNNDLDSGLGVDAYSEVRDVNVTVDSRDKQKNSAESPTLLEELNKKLKNREKHKAQQLALEPSRNQSLSESQPVLPLQSVVEEKTNSEEFRTAKLAGVNNHRQTDSNPGEKISPDTSVYTTIRTHSRWDYNVREVNHFVPMNQPAEVDVFKRRTDASVDTVVDSAAVKEVRRDE
ncbi:hypothetical protein VL10_20830 [Leclercia adecarboxylata]|nr:hypothetical protein VL10_20830 [Leclercia adecarboxylata]KMN64107.1 hypothetical protein VK95_16445 [Leclercia sp. LK8]